MYNFIVVYLTDLISQVASKISKSGLSGREALPPFGGVECGALANTGQVCAAGEGGNGLRLQKG